MSKELVSVLYKNMKFNQAEAISGKESEKEVHELVGALFATAATT